MGRKSRKSKKPTPHDEKTDADITEGKVVAITREQALIGLIETAIRLLADGKDIGSIHVLTFAAWKVLRDLGAKDGKGPEIHTDPRKFLKTFLMKRCHPTSRLRRSENSAE
jgi:hypothetical protein